MDFGEKVFKKNDSFVFRKIADECILVPIRQNVGDLESIYTLVVGQGKEIFSQEAIRHIFRASSGIPCRINQLCRVGLFIGFNKNVKLIKEEIIQEASKYDVS